MSDPLTELAAAGTTVWLDDLSRSRLSSGELERLCRERSIVGVTTNPAIFAAALERDEQYAAPLRELAARGVCADEAARTLTAFDVRWAANVLRPSFDASAGADGRVSLEVDPRHAHDTEATIADAKALWWLVERPNVLIKIPATLEGLPAVTEVVAAGVNVNVTLIFSPERYEAVLTAFLDGAERAVADGIDPATIGAVMSFFVSRTDTEVDRRLEKIGSPGAKALQAQASIAYARLAYERHTAFLAGERWAALARAGVSPPRLLWASVPVKNPAFPAMMYVEALVAPGTVMTLPEWLIDQIADSTLNGDDVITGNLAEAHRVAAELEALGVDFDDVTRVLEAEGVADFKGSWLKGLDRLQASLRPVTAEAAAR
ncbi:transaldolase [Micromonospora sp. NPDC049240]|uniref:transaldolase n=1 Tax=Micromonospora sp. NPDC049240 TaxID=3155151 RepID=UPI003400722D